MKIRYLIRKCLSSAVALSLLIMCLGTTVSAQDENCKKNDSELNHRIYDRIIDDYILQTGLSKEQADVIFEEIASSVNISKVITSIAKDVLVIDEDAEYSENVLYIQSNYESIVDKMSDSEKYYVDKYFLASAIQYYKDFADSSEFNDAVSTTADVGFNLVEPIEMNSYDDDIEVQENEIALQPKNLTRGTTVAQVRIFADSTGESSIINTSGHAWLTIKNVSNSNITVGKFSIAPNKTIAVGTWGNKEEHNGLWYSLEPYFVHNYSTWSNRSSLLVNIDSTALATLTTYIVNHDSWSLTNNCSSFAVGGWNQICSTTLSAGVINTPTNLKNSIINTGLSSTGISVPYNYVVYYADGSNTPIRSSEF